MTDRPRDALGRPLARDADGADVVPGVPERADLSAYDALQEAGRYLLEGKPFHAHEIFEQRWRVAPTAERELWRSLAQWGAALTHDLRGNPTGAEALLRRAAAGLTEVPPDSPPLVAAVPELRIGDFTLDGVRESDRADLEAAFDDPAIRQWNPGSSGGDPVVAAERLISELALPMSDAVTWLVRDNETARLLGRISFFHVSLEQGRGEVGYWTAPWARGRGVAATAVAAISEWAIRTLEIRRIELFHAADNAASCAVARRAGYDFEGTLRASYVYGDGQPHDEHLHALVRR